MSGSPRSATDAIDSWQSPWSSFGDVVSSDAIADAHAPFLTELDRVSGRRREWSRGEWRDFVARSAQGLRDRGVRAGDSVALLAGNSADALAVAFACWANDWVYLPLNAHETIERQRYIVEDAQCRILLHSTAMAEQASAILDTIAAELVSTSDLQADVEYPLPLEGGSLQSVALRVYTSGTTGDPKGVVLTVQNLLTDVHGLAQVTEWDADTRVLVVLPIHHVNGLVVSSLQAWCVGASVVLCDRFRSEFFWSDVAGEQATVCSMVPTLLEFLLEQKDGEPAPGFVEVYTGAGPLMTETVLGFERRFNRPVRHLYGMSEATAVATMMPVMDTSERAGWYSEHGFPSIGCSVPHVDVTVLADDGQPCPEGVRGEIAMRGATVMREYANQPDSTAEAMRDGWLHSGDEGFWLPARNGLPYFFVTGRIKELIIRGGVNISPFQVDEVLNAHPKVRFALAIPFVNRYYGEEIAAYVVPAESVDEAEILAFCAERLDFALQPKAVLFGDDVPFTATGKAKRLLLKQQLAEALAPYRDVQFRRSSGPR